MVAEREHAMVLDTVVGHGGSFYAAAMDEPQVFGYYFLEHILLAEAACGCAVYPFAYGSEGAFLIMSAARYGWWHDPISTVTHISNGTDTNKAIVFGMDADRLAIIHAQASSEGIDVVRCVQMNTNEVFDGPHSHN